MPIDLGHIAVRVMSRFDPESRYYWPLVVAVFLAIAANIVWYYWRPRDQEYTPAEDLVRPWVLWINVIFLIWALVMLMAKVPFFLFVVSFAVDLLALAYVYFFWVPPHDAAWERELRRLKYIPKPEQRRRRRRR